MHRDHLESDCDSGRLCDGSDCDCILGLDSSRDYLESDCDSGCVAGLGSDRGYQERCCDYSSASEVVIGCAAHLDVS